MRRVRRLIAGLLPCAALMLLQQPHGVLAAEGTAALPQTVSFPAQDDRTVCD